VNIKEDIMADARNFRKYLEELSGNNYLKKKVKALEKKNETLEKEMKELKDLLKQIKTNIPKALPKQKGRKPRPMIRIIEDELAKQKDGKMKVTDIVKMLKRKNIKSKTQNLYSSVAASLANSPKFEKIGKGEYRLKSKASAAPAKKKVVKKATKGKSKS